MLPDEVGQLRGLAHMDLGYNQVKSLPDSLIGMTALKVFYINDNELPYIPNAVVAMLGKLDNFKIEPNNFDVPEEARKGGLKAVCNFLKHIAKS